jgi:uncharacterized membrane protein
MLVGCGYFLDLSFARGWIGPSERIALGIIAGAALVAAATRFLGGTYRVVAECAVGLGAGVVDLSTWAAIAVFPDLHIPRAAAFAVMAIGAVALTLIANRWRSQPIALMALAAAYLTPILLGCVFANLAAFAAYLIVVTSGMLILARRRSFLAVEIVAVVVTLSYSLVFCPSLVWSNLAAASVASCIFLMFAAAFTTRPIGNGVARSLAIVPFTAAATVYMLVMECLLNASQTVLGVSLLGLATVLLAIPVLFKRISPELKPAYQCLALLAGNLALRSLLHRTELFDMLSIEAAMLARFGARRDNPSVVKIGLSFFALAAGGLLWEAATLEPAQTVCTPLSLGFAVWLQSAFTARRAVPQNVRCTYSLVTHGVALAALTRAALDLTGGPAWNVGLPNLAQLTLSFSWALFAAALFARGVTTRANVARWEGLALFAVTTIKVFTVDLASLDSVYRTLAFLGTGVVLFGSAAWYLRSLRLLREPDAARGPELASR